MAAIFPPTMVKSDGRRVLVIGHVATRWGLDHVIGGVPLEDLMDQDFTWQEGWPYRLGTPS